MVTLIETALPILKRQEYHLTVHPHEIIQSNQPQSILVFQFLLPLANISLIVLYSNCCKFCILRQRTILSVPVRSTRTFRAVLSIVKCGVRSPQKCANNQCVGASHRWTVNDLLLSCAIFAKYRVEDPTARQFRKCLVKISEEKRLKFSVLRRRQNEPKGPNSLKCVCACSKWRDRVSGRRGDRTCVQYRCDAAANAGKIFAI